MKTEFISYAEAVALKELGFDEPCLAWFAETKELQIAPETYKKWTSKPCNNSNIIKIFNVDCITAPTFSQAFRWFREKYGLWQIVMQNTDKDWTYDIMPIIGMIDYKIFDVFDNYEEAELACLKKLIEIVKNK